VELTKNGWQVESTAPLRVTINAPVGMTGTQLADRLRAHGVECEYADPEFLVLMATPDNTPEDFSRVMEALGVNTAPAAVREPIPIALGKKACSIREALFAPHETIPTAEGLGRICASPTVSCPPAIPIAVSGEVIGKEAMELFEHYGVETLDVIL
jgi:arginine/lysine/ornithine decarboxylase